MSRAVWLVPFLLVVVAGACRDATQVRVRVESTLNCPGDGAPELGEATVLAGPKGKVEGPIQTLVAACEEKGTPNYLGDIVVFPREEKDGNAEVWVVASTGGAGQTAEGCLQAYQAFVDTRDPATFPSTCIIAKRRVAFVPHEELRLTIRLDVDCAGKACEPDTTCFDKGQCRSSDVDCTGTDCGLGGGTSSTTSGGGDGGASSTSTLVTSSVVTGVTGVTSVVSGVSAVSTVTTTIDAASSAVSTVDAATASSTGTGGACATGDLLCTYPSPMVCGPSCVTECVDGLARTPCCDGSACYCGGCINQNVCEAHCQPYGGVAQCDGTTCRCNGVTPATMCEGSID